MTLRSEDEVQRAHDMLVELVLDEFPVDIPQLQGPQTRLVARVVRDTLCWTLRHDHNTTTMEFLRTIKLILDEYGLVQMNEKERNN